MLPEVKRFRNWLRRRSPHATTSLHYTRDLKLFFDWIDKGPFDITLHDIDAYVENCQRKGHAVATINRRLAALRSFYNFLAVDVDDAPPNPVLPKRHFVRQGQRLPRDAQDADIERLFAVIVSPRDTAMFLLMVRCGLRVQEVRDLSLDDLYLQPSPIGLPRLWVRGKGDAHRVVYLSAQALRALEDWLAVRPNVQDQALFVSRLGRRMSSTAIQMRIAHYSREAGVWITCHQLRHSFGRHLVEADVPVTTIRRLLGHKRLRTTQLYIHVSDRQVQANYEAAMEQISQRLSLQGGTG